jgi:hypothetical protein
MMPALPAKGSVDAIADPVLGALALLQVVLTIFGGTSGGLTAVLLNEKWSFALGVAVLLFGFLLAGIARKDEPSATQPPRYTGQAKLVRYIGLGLVLAGVAGTLYTAVGAPSIRSDPTVNASITGTPTSLSLKADISASGISRSSTFQVLVLRLTTMSGTARVVGTSLYHAELGADSEGNVSDSIEMPLPAPSAAVSPYDSLAVVAGTGTDENLCLFPRIKKENKPILGLASVPAAHRPGDLGCAFIRLTGK